MIMCLSKYYNRKVQVMVDDMTIMGIVTDYFYPEDNPNGEESIIIHTSSADDVELYASEITRISVI